MGTTSARFSAPEVLVRRVLSADGTESATVRLRCPDCGRRLVMKNGTIRDFLTMPLLGAVSPSPARRLRPPRSTRDTSQAPSDLASATLGEVMVRNVVCVQPGTSIEALRAVLLERGISGAPVVDGEGNLVGVVSKTDLLRSDLDEGQASTTTPVLRARTDDGLEVPLGPGFHLEDIPGALVGEIMTPLALALPSHATVVQASALMAYEGVHRIIVVDYGDIVGIVTATDVLRWIACHFGWAVPGYTQSQRGLGEGASS